LNQQKYINLVVTGASGRVGQLLCDLAGADESNWELVGAVAHPRSSRLGQPAFTSADHATVITPNYGGKCDLVIDFSSPAGAETAIQIALREGAALLVGTTGLPDSTRQVLEAAARRIAVLVAPNTSLGVATCAALVEQAARSLGPNYRVEIVEAHHKHKKDAPSGTALMLADAARQGGAEMKMDQIHALRGGDVVGEHTIRFAGEGEYVEVTHRATSRSLFALGALRAGQWLVRQKPGYYRMADMLQ
jgi:4-hydroxy-tetrahydrodipicolinate reductase